MTLLRSNNENLCPDRGVPHMWKCWGKKKIKKDVNILVHGGIKILK